MNIDALAPLLHRETVNGRQRVRIEDATHEELDAIAHFCRERMAELDHQADDLT